MNVILFTVMTISLSPAEVLIDPDSMTIARLQYDGGGDWYANPSSLSNLLEALSQRTGLPVARQEATVTPLDPALRDYPYLYMTGHGDVVFTPAERVALREYLLSGGFLHADDNYGLDEKASVKKFGRSSLMRNLRKSLRITLCSRPSMTFLMGSPRSTSMMESHRKHSVSSSMGACWCSIRMNLILEMGGKTRAFTRTHLKREKMPSVWG